MGNRSFFYLVDRMPSASGDEPQATAHIAESNNAIAPFCYALFARAAAGPAQDMQQVFLSSNAPGLYVERRSAEARMFKLLDFMASHPAMRDRAAYVQRVNEIRRDLAALPGAAYCADVNEYLHLGGESSTDGLFDLANELNQMWTEAERAIDSRDYGTLDRIYRLDGSRAALTLGLQCFELEQEEADFTDVYLDNRLYGFCIDGKWGVRSETGDVLRKAELDELYGYYEDVALAKVDGLWGYLDTRARWLVPPRFDDAFDFQCGRALAFQRGLGGYLDKMGRFAIAPQYLEGSDGFEEWGAIVQTASGFGLIDRDGAVLIPGRYHSISAHEEIAGMLVIEGAAGHYGLWSLNDGRESLPCAFHEPYAFEAGDFDCIAVAAYAGGCVVLNSADNYRVQRHYDWIECQENRALGGEAVADLLTAAWQREQPAYALRAGSGWRLYPDGVEVNEALYQARLVADFHARARDQDLLRYLANNSPHSFTGMETLFDNSRTVDPHKLLAFLDLADSVKDSAVQDGQALYHYYSGRLYAVIRAMADSMRVTAARRDEALTRAVSHFEQFGALGHAEADIMLGRCYLGDFGGTANLNLAQVHLERALLTHYCRAEAEALLRLHGLASTN